MKRLLQSTFVLCLILSSCAGGGEDGPPIISTEPDTPEDTNVTTLNLGSNDQMQYDKTELRVKEGQKVTLNLKHNGTMDKESMGHNFVLLKQGTDIAEFATKAMDAKNNDYIPEGDAVIAHTKVIGGGESTSVTFDAPEKGSYDFICSFPAHYALMQGKFIVE